MYKYIVLSLLYVIFPSTVFSQSIEDVLKDYDRGRIERVREMLPLLEARYYDQPEFLFLKAVFEEDGETAFAIYSEINENFPDDPIFERVLWRMCQYNYAKGLYVTCSEMVDRFLERFPDSDYTRNAMELRQNITDYLGEKEPQIEQEPVPDQPVFTIQVGAFASRTNARRQLSYYRRLGIYNSEIREQTVGERTLFKIWVGEFNSKDEAREAGEELKRRYRIPAVTIVQKNQ